MDCPAATVAGLLAMYCFDWVAMDGPAMAAMVAGSTALKPVFTSFNLMLVEAFMLVTAVLSMLVTTSSETVESSTLVAALVPPVINFVPGAFLICPAKAPAAVA